MEGRDRRHHEDELLKSLGGKGRKPNKMPYPIYMEVVKKRKELQRREREEVYC